MGCRLHVNEVEEVDYVDSRAKEGSFRRRCIRSILSRRVQGFLAFLLLLDMVALFTVVFLDAHFPPCDVVLQAVECPNQETVSCLPFPHEIHNIHSFLYILELSILGLFELEMFFLFYCLRFQFFRSLVNIMDLAIITLSIVLEVILHNSSNQSSAAGLLIFARLWRLVRIGHGILHHTKRKEAVIDALENNLSDEGLYEDKSDLDHLKKRISVLQNHVDLVERHAQPENP